MEASPAHARPGTVQRIFRFTWLFSNSHQIGVSSISQERTLRLCVIKWRDYGHTIGGWTVGTQVSDSKPSRFCPAKGKWEGGGRGRRNGKGERGRRDRPSWCPSLLFSAVMSSGTSGGPVNHVNVAFPQYIHPADAVKLGQAELVVIDEAAAIPLPLVKSLLGPYLVFMASTINGWDTGACARGSHGWFLRIGWHVRNGHGRVRLIPQVWVFGAASVSARALANGSWPLSD